MTRTRLVISIVGGGLLLIVLGGLLLPSHWTVERRIVVARDAAALYPLIADLERGWKLWSPFGQSQDDTIQMQYTGPAVGAGATQTWTQGRAGDGRLEITAAQADRSIAYQLRMNNGFTMAGQLELVPVDGQHTAVVWRDTGELGANPVWHYVGVFLESMVGRSIEQALSTLKVHAEQANH